MKYTILLILGVALFILSGQDLIRILANTNDSGLFGWVPGGVSLHIGIDVILIVAGGGLAGWATKKTKQ